jgi:uncharacterized membrane protein YcjF (UPF0283 family)
MSRQGAKVSEADATRRLAATRRHEMADDRGPSATEKLVSLPPAEASHRPRRGRKAAFAGLILFALAVGVFGDRALLRGYKLEDLWVRLGFLYRTPLTVFFIGIGCVAVAAAIAIIVYVVLVYRFGNRVLKKAETFDNAMEGYKTTNQALQSILRPYRLGALFTEANRNGVEADAPPEAQILQMPDQSTSEGK